jgi:glycosyltransferase involved in cell wall biosynthesis
MRFVERQRWRNAFQAVDACTFTARELAERWRAIGLPVETTIVEIPEAGTTMGPIAQDEARAQTGLAGTPAVLWVGRANANKDPAVAVSGFLKASRALRDPQLWMIVPTPADRKVMEAQLHDVDRSRIHLLEQIPHAQMYRYYSAADLLVSASHHEGSGYAVIEALACGVTPCVTNIPAFRTLVGTCGELWTPGDAEACATAIERGARHVSPERRRQIRTHFVTHLSWPAIGRRTLDSYTALHHSHA